MCEQGNYILTWKEHLIIEDKDISLVSNIDAGSYGGLAR
jgi:hypothetical protein